MASYKVQISQKVRKKDLSSIQSKDLKRIIEKIRQLANDPYPAGSIQLRGRKEYRIRQGNHRILYVVEESIVTVFVIKVGHRKNIYKA